MMRNQSTAQYEPAKTKNDNYNYQKKEGEKETKNKKLIFKRANIF